LTEQKPFQFQPRLLQEAALTYLLPRFYPRFCKRFYTESRPAIMWVDALTAGKFSRFFYVSLRGERSSCGELTFSLKPILQFITGSSLASQTNLVRAHRTTQTGVNPQ
jgi:hypothetical protein